MVWQKAEDMISRCEIERIHGIGMGDPKFSGKVNPVVSQIVVRDQVRCRGNDFSMRIVNGRQRTAGIEIDPGPSGSRKYGEEPPPKR